MPAYQALYRRYRPQRFSDVRGQPHVTKALLNSVKEGRVAHAYLFSGPRGTGKTSTARILAMALNCQAPVDGEPDGTCPSCVAIRNGSSMDVLELDAASNRKLDEMRDLLSRVALGTPGRWKVYIIDEVHQLTSDAASALLKTLEEPPGHVVFVLATTDPQRVLPTILSRTQHFEFHLFPVEVLSGLLEEVNEKAGLQLPPEILQMAVRRGRGSARDALSALDQLASAGEADDQADSIGEVVAALGERDVGAALRAVAQGMAGGLDPRRLGSELVEHLRNAFLASQAPSLVQLPGTLTATLAEQANQLGLPLLVRAMELIGQALVEMRDSVDARVTLEVALIRCASPGADHSAAALLERIERLERKTAGDRQSTGTELAEERGKPVSTPAGPPNGGPASQPGAPGAGPAQARAALGAFLRGGPSQAGGSSPRGEQPGGPAPVAPASVAPAPAAQAPAAQAPAAERPPTHPGPGASPGPSSPPGAGTSEPPGLPDRDQLTMAWGDAVLAQLPKTARVYLANGRWVETNDGAAVLALPDRGLLDRAANFIGVAQQALTAHFGRPIPLRFSLDTGAEPPAVAPQPATETYDLEALAEVAPIPEVPIEQRLLQAFPGALFQE